MIKKKSILKNLDSEFAKSLNKISSQANKKLNKLNRDIISEFKKLKDNLDSDFDKIHLDTERKMRGAGISKKSDCGCK